MKKTCELKISTLGELKIDYSGHELTSCLSAKANGLICFLAVNRKKNISRMQLAEMLWGETSSDAAKYNLRFTVWQIKKICADEFRLPEIICADKNTYVLNDEIEVSVDIEALQGIAEELKKGNFQDSYFERAGIIYQGDFMNGYDFKGSIKFNDWVFYESEELQRLYFNILEQIAEKYKEQHEYHKIIKTYSKILILNPYLEEVHVELIRTYIKIGDRQKALKQYERCCTLLKDELNVQPLDETKAVYEEIMSGQINSAVNASKADRRPRNISGVKPVFLYVGKEEFTKQELSADPGSAVIPVRCLQREIPYYALWKMLRQIFERSENIAKDIPERVLLDLAAIYGPAEDHAVQKLNSRSCVPEKIRLFASVTELLERLSAKEDIRIYIENFERIDQDSLAFIAFFLENSIDGQVAFHLAGMEESAFQEELRMMAQKNRRILLTETTT